MLLQKGGVARHRLDEGSQTVGLAGFNVALCRTTGTSRFVCQIMVLNMLAATVGIEPTTYCLTGSRSTF